MLQRWHMTQPFNTVPLWMWPQGATGGPSFITGIILGMDSANERPLYSVTSSLIGWAIPRMIPVYSTAKEQYVKCYKHSQGCGAISCSGWRITPVKTYTVKYFQVIILVLILAINQTNLLHKHHNTPVRYLTLWDICIIHCGIFDVVLLGINSSRPSDAYMRQWSNHQWFR